MSSIETESKTEPKAENGRRRGRPRKPEAERRTERVTVRLSPAELAQVDAKADRAGRPVSTYLREAGLGKRLVSVEERADRDETIRRLTHVGVRLDRIAGVLTTGDPSTERLREAIDALEDALERV